MLLVTDVLGDVHTSTSHDTAGVFREYERCVTTIVDAALSPLLVVPIQVRYGWRAPFFVFGLGQGLVVVRLDRFET